MRPRVMRGLSPVSIDQEGDLGEGIKGNSDRQQDVHAKTGREQGMGIGGKEAGIFEIGQHQKVAGHAGREDAKPRDRAQTLRNQRQADQVVEGDRRQQQQPKLPVAHRIEYERRQRQPYHRRQIASPAEGEIAEQNDRQEQKNERVGIEEHRAFSGSPKKPNHTSGRSTSGAALAQGRHIWQSARENRYDIDSRPIPPRTTRTE
ncbi:hypothetical protein GALL_463040 [mine drainage metagenome]|uniref:Uncharacterized protein n=1 Tax=mine drainage metagenome TaxID=410659 RepID=A0A1J5PMP6_9ZZZZ